MASGSQFPAPNEYADWKSWAAVLVSVLGETVAGGVVNLPTYVADATVSRGGLPPAAKGDMVWFNEGGVRKLAVWDGQTWIKYSPDK